MSAVQSTTLPWMLKIQKMTKTLLNEIHSFDFFILLYGFLYGNIFAIQYSTMKWGLFFIFGVVFFLEMIQRVLYLLLYRKSPKQRFPFSFFLVNTLKRGFLLGFFVEAFKVGS